MLIPWRVNIHIGYERMTIQQSLDSIGHGPSKVVIPVDELDL